MAGYSGTPLFKKLGIKEGHRVVLLDAPEGFEALLQPLPDRVKLAYKLGKVHEVVVLFVREFEHLEARLPKAIKGLTSNGGLWVAWPKRASKVETNISEDRVRNLGLLLGLVDNKVCAIDEVWSGLRLVYRLKDRPEKKK